jgi:hypothetical protein
MLSASAHKFNGPKVSAFFTYAKVLNFLLMQTEEPRNASIVRELSTSLL